MKARKSVSVRHAGSADEALSSGDDFRASAPGKPFLKALLATFNTLEQQQQQQQQQRKVQDDASSSLSDDSFRRRVRRLSSTKRTAAFITTDPSIAEAGASAGEFVLRINAQCLFYLQQLFRAMLVPVTSDQGLVKQWRINVMFLNGLEDVEEVDLGPASPRNILRLGGHMLEQTALIINGTSDEANLGAPGAFDLAFFPRLQHLRLDQCNLADVKGLSILRSRLKELRFYSRLIDRLSTLLEPTELEHSSTDAKREAGSTWTQLESLAVVNCSLTELDSSFELLPVVKIIRLSQNQLSSIGQLEACTCLQELDLSFNHISSMVGANQILSQIISLDLSHNMLSSTAGLEKLFTIEVLNLSHNAISSISEVGYLVSLPNLHSLFLRGNPIESSPTYRSDVQKLLTNEVTLDGIPWASQDVDDFAKQGELKDEFSASLLILKHQGRVGGKLESRIETAIDRSYLPTNNRVAVLVRSLLLAMAAIVIVQGIVHLTWSLDIESERLLLKLLGSLAAVGAMVFTTFSILSWTVNRLIRRATVDVPAGVKAHQQSEGRFRRLSRRVSSCLVDETFVRRQAPAANGTRRSDLGAGKFSITVLQTSLQSLSEFPEELSLLVFLNVCSELQTMVELLSPTASNGDGGGLIFAWNILARCISTLEASAGDLRRATVQELLHDDTERVLEPNTSDEPVEAALQDTVHLFKFMAKFLLELTSGTADKKQENDSNVLAMSLLSAYRHAFAQLHPWIVQKTIADTIPVSSPSQSVFYAALRRGNERIVRNDLILKDVLRTCADELQACASFSKHHCRPHFLAIFKILKGNFAKVHIFPEDGKKTSSSPRQTVRGLFSFEHSTDTRAQLHHSHLHTHSQASTMTKVNASDLCHLLQKRASSAMAHRRGPSPSRPELEFKLKSEEIRPPAPASATEAPVAPVPVVVPQSHKQQPLLSADEVIAAHRRKHARYFTMLRVGIPRDTVEQAMRLAGVDPVELDGPHLVVDAATTTGDSSAGVLDARSSMTVVSRLEAGHPGHHHHHALGRKKALRKRLYWDVKVDNPSLGSEPNKAHSRGMWGHSAQPIVAVSDETKAQLEKLFAKEAIVSESDFKSSIASRKKAPVRISLLDTKKAQNIGITLARVKLSLPQLVKELIHMNPTVLCAAQLQGLLDMWPDRKELEAIDEFTGDRTLLGTAEQFFLETRAITRFREKLRCLIFKQEFPLRVHELRESINLVIRAINQVISSPALQQMMRFILQLGNFLNCGGGTCSDSLAHQYPHPHQLIASPRVVGFSLSSLTKLGQIKAFAGGVTFLQFAVQAVDVRTIFHCSCAPCIPVYESNITVSYCETMLLYLKRDCPHLVHFHKEINLISKCAKVSIQSLLVEQKALETGWKALIHEAQAGIPAATLDEDCEDNENELYLHDITDGSLIVSSILAHFAVEVENELDAIQELLEQLMESKQRFLEYFDEQDSAEELDALLQYIARFADEFSQQHARLAETKHAVDKAS